MSDSVLTTAEFKAAPPVESPMTARVLLLILVVVNLPLFLAMPLTNDVILYDVQARNLLNGGVQYRELFETNLPGIVWIHMLVRSAFGWRSEVMRAFDLVLFSGSVWLLSGWVRRQGKSEVISTWVAFALFWVWFSVTEWCHCQRDGWMLLPALLALGLRSRQVHRIGQTSRSAACTLGWAFVEGLCWAAAFWIKPFVIVPAALVWLVSAVITRRPGTLFLDFCGLLMGGLLAGAAGIAWMYATGAWPYFLETFLVWNPEYVRSGKAHWTFERFMAMVIRLFPWILLHLVAVPMALVNFWRGLFSTSSPQEASQQQAAPADAPVQRWLFATFYLGWLAQSFLLQHLFDYIHAPAILLAVVLIASYPRGSVTSKLWKPMFVGFVLLAAISSPILRANRLSLWASALQQGSTTELRQKLAHQRIPSWGDLEKIKEFLEEKNVQEGDVTCLNGSLVALYDALEFKPSTRFTYLQESMIFFPSQRKKIYEEIAASHQKYIVTDLSNSGFSVEQSLELGPLGPRVPPPDYSGDYANTYPWSNPVVYRAGPYLVHQLTEPLGRFRPFVPVQPATHSIAGKTSPNKSRSNVTASTDTDQ